MSQPSVDLDYPTPAHGRIPAFRSVEEESEFWDTHDLTDFLEESRPVHITVAANLSDELTVQLDQADRRELDRLAKIRGIGPSTLARVWLTERLHRNEETG